jgi:hypothetical protein
MGDSVGRSLSFTVLIFWVLTQSTLAVAGRIPPKPTTPPPNPTPNPTPNPSAGFGEMEFAITPFANMEHGWHIFEPDYRAVCADSQGVVATAKLSIDAAVNGETADGKGLYQALIIRPVTQYQRRGLTSGTCELTICLDQNSDSPKSPSHCQSVVSVTDPDPDRALSFKGSVPYKAVGDKISLQTGAPGLSAWHPVFSFAAPAKAFKDFQSPLVIDMNGDDLLDLTGVDGSHVVRFDLSLEGKAYPTGWVGAADGLLAVDLNGNGIIDDGRELFGEMTGGSVMGAKTAKNGFIALARYDSNLDGTIDPRDRDFARLRVWIDRNQDGQTNPGELTSLTDAKIKSIDLTYKSTADDRGQYPRISGNEIRLTGSFTMIDGSKRKIEDVWFKQRRFSDQVTAMTNWLLQTPSTGK